MAVQQESFWVTTGWYAPERLNAAGVDFGVADSFGFFRCQVHRFEDVANCRQVEIGIGESRAQRVVEIRERDGLVACRRFRPDRFAVWNEITGVTTTAA